MKKIEQDTMPREVAREMLCEPKARMTNRMRKTCLAAFATSWVSEQEPKPVEAKLRSKMQSLPIDRLARVAHRIEAKRRGVQLKYEAAKRMQAKLENPNPVLERTIALLDLRAAQMELVLDASVLEQDFRRDLTEGILHHGGTLLGVQEIPCVCTWAELNKARTPTLFSRWVRVKMPGYVPADHVARRRYTPEG